MGLVKNQKASCDAEAATGEDDTSYLVGARSFRNAKTEAEEGRPEWMTC